MTASSRASTEGSILIMAGSVDSLDLLAETLGHRFADPKLLVEAVTHPSAAKLRGTARRGYERLEFLGDRVLSLIVADLLWRRFPEASEGELTRRHTQLVKQATLATVATKMNLGRYLAASPGEAATGLHENASVLADLCEAVIAALYLDGGLAVACGVVERWWGAQLADVPAPPLDPKTALQEWAQAQGLKLPVYRTLKSEGPAHRRSFTVSVSVQGLPDAAASGPSKRTAETAAAAATLANIAAKP
jgi:ribonuclease-3